MSPAVPSTAQIASLWQRLATYSQQHGLKLLAELRGPAETADLVALQALPWPIPVDLLASLQLHDGENERFRGSRLFGGARLLPISEMLEVRRWNLEALQDQIEVPDPEDTGERQIGIGPVRAQCCHPDWLPILQWNARLHWFVDFAPLDSGVAGQIIRVDVETGENVVCANSFDEFLENYVLAVEAGQFRVRKGGLDWREPWPPLAQVPWLSPGLLDAERIAVVGQASSWRAAAKLADGVLQGAALLRVHARAKGAAGKPRLALAALNTIRVAGEETAADFELRLDLLDQAGRNAERLAELDRAIAAQGPDTEGFPARPVLLMQRARLHLTLAEEPPTRMSPGQTLRWASSPAGQQHAAVCRERAIADLQAALELQPRQTWWLELADVLLQSERWVEAESAYRQVLTLVGAMAEIDPHSQQRLESAEQGIQRARKQEIDDEDDSPAGTLDSLNALLQSLGTAFDVNPADPRMAQMREMRDTFSELVEQEQEQIANDSPEAIEADARAVAEQLARRYQRTPVRLVEFSGPAADKETAKFHARAERILATLNYSLLGDYELLNHTEMTGQVVQLRVFLSSDRLAMATVWRLPTAFGAMEAVEFESELDDGRMLTTTNTGAANPFEAPALIESQALPAGTAIKLLHHSHQQRLAGATAKILPIADLEAVVALLDRQRQLMLEHGLAIGGVSDRELRGMLGASYGRLAHGVRLHLRGLLGLA